MISISQTSVSNSTRKQIAQLVINKRVPNTMLISCVDGGAGLAVALSLAKMMVCDAPKEADSCNTCTSCLQFDLFNYPNLHLSFPFSKSKSKSKDPNCSEFRALFTEALKDNIYLTHQQWLTTLQLDKQQASITVAEAKSISHSLSLKSPSNKPRFVLMWQPENLHVTTANKLLKTIEEPGENVYVFMVSHQPKKVLKTILSRCITLKLPPNSDDEIERILLENGLSAHHAAFLLPTIEGSVGKAYEAIDSLRRAEKTAEELVTWLRILYSNDLKKLIDWSENMAAQNREDIKFFLDYSLQIIRQAFMSNQGALTSKPFEFANFQMTRFSPFIGEQNMSKVLNTIESCRVDILRNAHQKTTVLATSLQLSKYIG